MIKEVEEINAASENVVPGRSYRDEIDRDIKNAWEKNIPRFELVDDAYNYKYLAKYAKEEVERIVKQFPQVQDAIKRAKTIYGMEKTSVYFHGSDASRIIEVFNQKGKDRNHVFCEIHKENIWPVVEGIFKNLKEVRERAEKRKAERQAQMNKPPVVSDYDGLIKAINSLDAIFLAQGRPAVSKTLIDREEVLKLLEQFKPEV